MKKLPPAPREVQQLLCERGIVRGYAWWRCRAQRRASGASSGPSSLFCLCCCRRPSRIRLARLGSGRGQADDVDANGKAARRQARWSHSSEPLLAIATRTHREEKRRLCLLAGHHNSLGHIAGERAFRAANCDIGTSRAHFFHIRTQSQLAFIYLAFALPETEPAA